MRAPISRPFLITTVLALWLLTYKAAFAIDLQPNDIVAPPPDITALTLTYYSTQNTTYYSNGTAVSKSPYGNPVINTNSGITRISHTYSLAGLPGVSYVQLPYGTAWQAGSLAAYPASTGIGDTALATALWPYSNHETRTYLGLAAYLGLPTGTYKSSQAFNLGQNRYYSDVQMGFQTPIVGKVDGAIAVDTMFYGGNSQCAAACLSPTNVALNQKPLTTTQVGPIYNINQIFTVAANYIYVAGGAQSVNNVYLNNVINTQRYLLSAVARTPYGRFTVQYGRDMEIKNGFMQTELLALRYHYAF
ncbi:transporter [Polynucleobacter sp. MWH-UH2A]|uniref:transporter n=1 Tax=Polynucleobacter sp. MWH-UH2A TaxID=1855617 RepID=UPI001BFD089A|nr:transporter [Polynucleobacter sp. MWH-UH2A]QWD64918.1 transporter [Polynucleobacter sp. MWH-UH2A]